MDVNWFAWLSVHTIPLCRHAQVVLDQFKRCMNHCMFVVEIVKASTYARFSCDDISLKFRKSPVRMRFRKPKRMPKATPRIGARYRKCSLAPIFQQRVESESLTGVNMMALLAARTPPVSGSRKLQNS